MCAPPRKKRSCSPDAIQFAVCLGGGYGGVETRKISILLGSTSHIMNEESAQKLNVTTLRKLPSHFISKTSSNQLVENRERININVSDELVDKDNEFTFPHTACEALF